MEITRRHTVEEAGLDVSTLPAGWEEGDGKLASAFVRVTKPLAMGTAPRSIDREILVAASGEACCGSDCCS